MMDKLLTKLILVGFAVSILSLNGCADIYTFVNVSQDFPPTITSIKTFSSYTDNATNVQSTNFFAPNNKTVYIQVTISDSNGFEDVRTNGFLKLKIVLWDTINSTNFTRFGSDFVNATFESGSVNTAIYTYSFLMGDFDETRQGTETPQKYYRVIAQAYDGVDTIESNTSTQQIGTYTYAGVQTNPPPPVQVLFDVKIDIPENKKQVAAGDSFYATVEITKISPLGRDDVNIVYSILDSANQTVDYYSESVAINGTVFRLPVLYVPANATLGRYTFTVVVLYLGVGVWSNANFDVVASTTTSSTTSTTLSTTTTTRPGGGGGGNYQGTTSTSAHSTPTTIPKQIISVDFYKVPTEVIGFRGEVKPIMVVIENTGNVALSNITLVLEGGVLQATNTVPEQVDMEPGAKKVFILETQVPDTAAFGAYETKLRIIGPNVEKTQIMRFTVSDAPTDLRKKLSSKTDEISQLIDEVWAEAVKVSSSENMQNVSEVFRLLQKSKDNVGEAKEYLAYSRFNNTEQSLYTAVKYLERGVIELAEIRSNANISLVNQTQNNTQVWVRTKFTDLNWVITIAFILMVVLFIFLLYRYGRLGKKITELYDLGRIKGMIYGKENSSHDTGLKTRPGHK